MMAVEKLSSTTVLSQLFITSWWFVELKEKMELKETDDRIAFLESRIEELSKLRDKAIQAREKIKFLIVQLHDPGMSRKCTTIDEGKEFLKKQDAILQQLHGVDLSFILNTNALVGVDSDLKDEKSVIEQADEDLNGNQDCLDLNKNAELEEDLNVKPVNEQSDV